MAGQRGQHRGGDQRHFQPVQPPIQSSGQLWGGGEQSGGQDGQRHRHGERANAVKSGTGHQRLSGERQRDAGDGAAIEHQPFAKDTALYQLHPAASS